MKLAMPRQLVGLYDQISVWERISLLFAANARHDDTEYQRLFTNSPRRSFDFPNHFLVEQAIHLCSFLYITEQLDAAAHYFFAQSQLQHDDSDDWLYAVGASSYFFTQNAAAWRIFCERLGLSPRALVEGNYRGMMLQLCEERMPERAPSVEDMTKLQNLVGRSDGTLVTTEKLVERWQETLSVLTRHSPFARTP